MRAQVVVICPLVPCEGRVEAECALCHRKVYVDPRVAGLGVALACEECARAPAIAA